MEQQKKDHLHLGLSSQPKARLLTRDFVHGKKKIALRSNGKPIFSFKPKGR